MWILAGFLVVLLIIFGVALRVTRMKEIEQENRQMREYMAAMQDFYTVIQSRIEAVRRYRHDLAKHIRTLERLLEQQEEPEAMKEYMESLKGGYDKLKSEEYCADEIINAVVQVKQQQCQEKGIPLDIRIGDTDYSGIQEMDMVSLLYNLLDNAVEANERIPEGTPKGVSFSMGRTGGEIWIDVQNHILPGEEIIFKTKKEIKEEHGIGTKIIDLLIEKYHGRKEIHVDREQNLFVKKVVLSGEA